MYYPPPFVGSLAINIREFNFCRGSPTDLFEGRLQERMNPVGCYPTG
jgi:hypothetical protein